MDRPTLLYISATPSKSTYKPHNRLIDQASRESNIRRKTDLIIPLF